MTIRGTLGLAAVFLVLAGYLITTRPVVDMIPDASPRLTPPLSRATTIELTGGDHAPIRLARSADGPWVESLVPDVLEGLASLHVLAVVDDASTTPERYGFGPDAPRLRVAEGPTVLVAIEVGAMNPAETGVYVRRDDDPSVLLVGALLRWELEKLRRVVSTTSQP